MEGDKVSITSTSTENEGIFYHDTYVSEKPQFMMNEEYHQELIQCAINAVREACKIIYPNNEGTRIVLAEMIANRATREE